MTAPWFHASRTTVKRSAGRSVVAAAAYRTATRIECEREGVVHDYTRKGGVKEAFVTTPEGKTGCDWAQDISALTNAMEAAEKRKDAQVGHEWTIALPSVLDDAQRAALSRRLAQQLSDMYGVATIGAVHAPGREGDERNEHLHLLFTTREVEAGGRLGAKVTIITDRKTAAAEVTRYRHVVAQSINDALADAGFGEAEFVDARSFASRGIEQPATEHMGVAATNKERRSRESTQRGDNNRSVIASRIAEQEKLAEALGRQFDPAPSGELTLETERQLAQRFGEEWQADVRAPEHAVAIDGGAGAASTGGGGPQWTEETRQGSGIPDGMQAELDLLAATGTTQGHASPSLWSRVRAAADAFMEFLRDESGAGWMFGLGRAAPDGPDADSAGDLPGIAPEPGLPRPQEGGGPSYRERARPGGDVEPPGPDARPHADGFDAYAAQWAEQWAEDAELTPDAGDGPENIEPEPDTGPDMG